MKVRVEHYTSGKWVIRYTFRWWHPERTLMELITCFDDPWLDGPNPLFFDSMEEAITHAKKLTEECIRAHNEGLRIAWGKHKAKLLSIKEGRNRSWEATL